MQYGSTGRWPHLHYLTFIKLINCQVARSIIIEMTFPVLLLKGQEGQGERSPWGSSLSGAGTWGCTCQYLLPANLHWLLKNGPDDGLAAVGGGQGALVAEVAGEPGGTRQQRAQAERGGQIHRVPCGASQGHSACPLPGMWWGQQGHPHQFPLSR